MPDHIAIVIPHLAAGGAERVTTLLADYWAGRGKKISLLLFEDPDKDRFYELGPGVRLVLLPGSGRRFWSRNLARITSIRQFVNREKPDLVIGMMTYVNILLLLACLFTSNKAVISERIDPEWDELPRTWRVLRRMLYPFAAKLVVQTDKAASYFLPWLGERVAVIANPVDLDEFSFAEASRDPRRILSVGRLEHQKGHDVTLAAFATLPSNLKNACELVIYGEGSQRPVLERQICALDLEAIVSLPGTTTDIATELQRTGIFVMSSRFEGFPNALVEAMAAGCAVISSDCPSGPAELIDHGKNGKLMPVEDHGVLSAALQALLEQPEQQRKLGEQARRDVRRLALPDIAARWEALK